MKSERKDQGRTVSVVVREQREQSSDRAGGETQQAGQATRTEVRRKFE